MEICKFLSTWRMALLCSFIYCQHLGQKKIVGLQFVASIERYNASRKHASFAFQLGAMVYNLCGPLVGYLGSKFEMRSITICGCFVASISIAACFFAEDIIHLTCWWGLQLAISSSMAVSLLPSILHSHFKTNQAMANGIAFAGSCFGGFLFSPFYKLMLDNYGMSGSFLILGAIALHSVPAAMLLENPKPECKTKADLGRIKKSTSVSIGDSKERSAWKEAASRTAVKISGIDYKSSSDNVINCSGRVASEIRALKTEIRNAFNDAKIDNIEDFQDTKNCGNMNIPINVAVGTCISNEFCNISNCTTTLNDQTFHLRTDLEESVDVKIKCKLSQRRVGSDISITNDSTDSKEINSKEQDPSKTIGIHLAESNAPGDIIEPLPPNFHVSENEKPEADRSKANLRIESRGNMKPYSVLYDPIFILVSFTTSSHMFIMLVVHTVLVDFSIDKGLSVGQSVYLLMCLTIADMVGRFSLGWMTDKGHMSITNFIAICYFILALCFTLFAVTTNFFCVMISLAVAGLFMGSLMSVFPVMLSEYFPGKRNAMALSSRYILVVPACLVISPMIGYFRETLGSYVLMFYCIDSICLLCCVITLIMPTIVRLRGKETQK